jgi:hypothetical protein
VDQDEINRWYARSPVRGDLGLPRGSYFGIRGAPQAYADGSVTLTGVSHERDYAAGEGLFFEEISPFTMVITGHGEFTIRWCEFPGPFDIEVTRGGVTRR